MRTHTHTQSAGYALVYAGLAVHTQTHADFIIMSGSDPKEHLLAAVFQIREETLTRFVTLLLHHPHKLFIPHFLFLYSHKSHTNLPHIATVGYGSMTNEVILCGNTKQRG